MPDLSNEYMSDHDARHVVFLYDNLAHAAKAVLAVHDRYIPPETLNGWLIDLEAAMETLRNQVNR